jgi:hypothetical protein
MQLLTDAVDKYAWEGRAAAPSLGEYSRGSMLKTTSQQSARNTVWGVGGTMMGTSKEKNGGLG